MRDNKRYEASYINPNFCDGFWDNKETKYLDIDEIKDILYDNLNNSEIEKILNRDIEKMDEKNNGLKLTVEGLGIVLLGIFNVVWYIIRVVSCIMIAGLISIRLGLSNYYWWFGSIIIFSLLCKVLFFGSVSSSKYGEIVENYNNKVKE